MKVVINVRYGGFTIFEEALSELGLTYDQYLEVRDKINFRSSETLIKFVEETNKSTVPRFSELRVVEVPDGIPCHIEEYDGREWIAEDHQTWGWEENTS